MLSQNTSTQLSRRKWLRDAAIATTGAAVLPSLLTGCTDHPPGLGDGPPLSQAEVDLYKQAAQNILNMRLWYIEMYNRNHGFVLDKYVQLKGLKEAPTDWKDVVIDIFIGIAWKFLEALVDEFPGGGAVVAITANEVDKWGAEQKQSNGVDAAISDFLEGYRDQSDKVAARLLTLGSSTSNYSALRDALKGGSVTFNGKNYDLAALAEYRFPVADNPDTSAQYGALIDAALLKFKKTFWNLILVKTAVLHYSSVWWKSSVKGDPGVKTPARYALEEHYVLSENVAAYIRGSHYGSSFAYRNYWFTVDDRELSAEVAQELFIDSIPGKILNPDPNDPTKPLTGLFPRDYVFKQFQRKRPDFTFYYIGVNPTYDVKNYKDIDDWSHDEPGNPTCIALDCSSNDYTFTAGEFPKLIEK